MFFLIFFLFLKSFCTLLCYFSNPSTTEKVVIPEEAEDHDETVADETVEEAGKASEESTQKVGFISTDCPIFLVRLTNVG